MLQIVYIILCVISIIKCINRKFDLYTIAVLSYIFYTLVCVIGETWITRSSGLKPAKKGQVYFWQVLSGQTSFPPQRGQAPLWWFLLW